VRAAEVRPDLGAALAAGLADEERLDVGEPHVIRPLNEGKFELSEPDGNRLAFAVGDLLDRLDKLMGDLDKGGAG